MRLRASLAFLLGSAVFGIAFAGCSAGGDATDQGGATGSGGSTTSASGGTGGAGGDECPSGTTSCDGECTSLDTNDACGACGVACGNGESCCSGVCVEADQCSFALTSVEPAFGWQIGGTYVTLHGSGFGSGMRVLVGDGRAPTRVIDDSTAVVRTPPGPVGSHDVSIELEGEEAVLHDAFRYDEAEIGEEWETAQMDVSRGWAPAMAPLSNGKVLIAGGLSDPTDVPQSALRSANVFDRATEKVTSATNPMSSPRMYASAAPLLDDTVLLVGGACASDVCEGDASLADLYDPASNSFEQLDAALTRPATSTSAALLSDGRVLVGHAAGFDIYDPKARTFTDLDHDVTAAPSFAVRLRDGRILLGGYGFSTFAEVFDGDTDEFEPVGSLDEMRPGARAEVLPDGRVLIIGGERAEASGDGYIGVGTLPTIEIFDPSTNEFATAPFELSQGRYYHSTALLRDGSILVFGGHTTENFPGDCASMTDSVERIRPDSEEVEAFASMPVPNAGLSSVALIDGTVVAAGGGACSTESLDLVLFLPAPAVPQ